MSRVAFGVLVVIHGLLTILIWAPRPMPDAPMNTSRSWLLGEARRGSLVLASVAGTLMVASGVGLLADQDWWAMPALAGGLLSLALFGLFFTPWWLLAIALSAALSGVAFREAVA